MVLEKGEFFRLKAGKKSQVFKSSTTSSTCGAGTAYPSGALELISGF